jgi:bud emergence protein 1
VPANDQELGFEKGDFFHVIGNVNDPDWYEACNPATNARGYVPVPYFQVMGKNERDSQDNFSPPFPSDSRRYTTDNKDSGFFDRTTMQTDRSSTLNKPAARPGAPLYGVVLYDFIAERPDELEAKTGEDIIVIAQSNDEWFVAKPIGRLGGPGLIPVDFVEIRDMATGVPVEDKRAAIARAGVPKVEEWKKMAAEYKNSSIALGTFDPNADAAAAAAAAPAAAAPPMQEVVGNRNVCLGQDSTFVG